MIARCLQIFSAPSVFVLAATLAAADVTVGNSYRISLRDVDGNEHSTAAGNVTIVTVVTRESLKLSGRTAKTVPDRCIGDPQYRYITILNFQRQIAAPLQGFVRAVIRRKLVTEVNKLKPKYAARNLTRDPRRDVLVVPDFDGRVVAQLGLTPQTGGIAVFVFGRDGELVARWNEVPSPDAMSRAIAAAE